jgi:WD40 repeat protein
MSPSSQPSEREERINAAIVSYLESVAIGSAPDREAFLAKYPDVADELRAFLNDHHRLTNLAGRPAEPETLPVGESAPASSTLGRVRYFGDYELFEEIARGAMGVVYKARQVSLNRPVALKMILAGELASPEDVARFRREAEAAATLDHPNIVSIYEVGEHEGQHYFAMKLVEGGTLSSRISQFVGRPKEAVALLCRVCRAVHYAHQHGILHRDLKPGNVLLDSAGAPYVSDFGLAKRLGTDSRLTRAGAILGTPSYMAPEQAAAKADVSTAADVYALGAILYELLTDRPPFQADTPLDTLMQVLDCEPTPPRQIQSRVSRDLETITLKCLEKAPAKRYGSALEIAEELERWLAGAPIQARPGTVAERVVKWMRRRPTVTGLLCLATVAALMFVIAGIVHNSQLRDVNSRLQDALSEAKSEREVADSERERAQTQERIALAQEAMAQRSLYAAHLTLAQQAFAADKLNLVRNLLNSHLPQPGREDLRSFEWYHLWRQCHSDLATLRGHEKIVECVAYSPDGNLLASGGADGTVRLWDTQTYRELTPLIGEKRSNATSPQPARTQASNRSAPAAPSANQLIPAIAFAPRGDKLAVLRGSGGLQLWEIATRKMVYSLTIPNAAAITCFAFSPDGRTLAAAGRRPEVTLWNVENREVIATFKVDGGWVNAVAFSPDGKILAAAGEFEGAAQVTLWKVASRQKRVALKRSKPAVPGSGILPDHFLVGIGQLTSTAFSPDGKLLACGFGYSIDHGNGETIVVVWDVESGTERWTLSGHQSAIQSVRFSVDGQRIVSASKDGTVRFWDTQTGRGLGVLRGHLGPVLGLGVSPDGKSIASGSWDGTIKIWYALPGSIRDTLQPRQMGVRSLALAPDARTLATAGAFGPVKLWDLTAVPAELPAPPPKGLTAHAVAYSPDGKTLAIGGDNEDVRLFDTTNLRLRADLGGHAREVKCLAFSPDGKVLACPGRHERALLRDATTGRQIATSKDEVAEVRCLAFSSDSKLLALGYGDPIYKVGRTPDIRIWEIASGQERSIPAADGRAVTSLAFSPDGETLAIACADAMSASAPGEIRLWDIAKQRVRAVLRGHEAMVWCVAIAPDGKTLASGAHDSLVKLWDPVTGEERATFKGHTGPVSCLTFSADNRLLISASGAPVPFVGQMMAGEVKVWRAAGPADPGAARDSPQEN